MPRGRWERQVGSSEGRIARPGVVWAGGKRQGQGELTGEVAVQADGDIVKSHGGSGSWAPPRNNLQPEPVGV